MLWLAAFTLALLLNVIWLALLFSLACIQAPQGGKRVKRGRGSANNSGSDGMQSDEEGTNALQVLGAA